VVTLIEFFTKTDGVEVDGKKFEIATALVKVVV